MILIKQPLKKKNSCKLIKNRTNPAVIIAQRSKNDFVRMKFPENSSLQCFRTAPLSMVTPTNGVTKSYGLFVYRKSLETVKISGVKGLMEISSHSARSHWLLRGHMTSNNQTVSRQKALSARMLTDDRRYS